VKPRVAIIGTGGTIASIGRTTKAAEIRRMFDEY